MDAAVSEDHKALKEGDEDGAELPLGEIMKNFKSQGAKKRKMAKRQAAETGLESLETDIDVLGMVREINLDNQETSPDVDSSQDLKHLLNEGKRPKITAQKNGKDEAPASASGSESKPSPPPSKKGSSRATKQERAAGKDILRSCLRFFSEEQKAEPPDSVAAMSCSPATRTSSSGKKKNALRGPNGAHVVGAGEKDTQVKALPLLSCMLL